MTSNGNSNSNSDAATATGDGVGSLSSYKHISSSKRNKVNDYCWRDVVSVSPLALTTTCHFYPNSISSSGEEREMESSKGSGYFTMRQWEELERQIMICKYMMASIPVPPHLLLTLSNTTITSSPYSTSHSDHNNINTSCRLDVRYTRGGGTNNDAEPWRCRRTDGKKWRCSRDVAPYQKYCERHAHKPRPRSRKHVEQQQQQHITTTMNTTVNSINNNNSRQMLNIPAIISGATLCAQPRCTEWFMKGDPIPGSSFNEQWQHLVQPSSRERQKLYDEHESAVSLFQKHYGDQEELNVHTNTYPSMNESSFHNQLDSDHQAQTTRHFIDAWSCADRKVEISHVTNQTPKFPLSSLSLSMSAGTEMDDNNENAELRFKPDWVDSNPYRCMQPGGPLGEALCLGICSTTKGKSSNLAPPPPPHGYNNSNSTTTSSCSEDNAHGLHFR